MPASTVLRGHSYWCLESLGFDTPIEPTSPPALLRMSIINRDNSAADRSHPVCERVQDRHAVMTVVHQTYCLIRVAIWPANCSVWSWIVLLTIPWLKLVIQASECDWTDPIPVPVMTQFVIAEIDLNQDKIPDLTWQVQGSPSGDTSYFVTVTPYSEFIGPPKMPVRLDPGQLIDPATFVP